MELLHLNRIEYCKICGMPSDYCPYGPSPSRCLETSQSTSVNEPNEKKNENSTNQTTEENKNSEKNKKSKESKIKQLKPKHILIKTETRSRRKNVTVITGLEAFDIPLNEASKKFSRQFSCGATVVKGVNGKSDHVDVQGDFEREIAEFIIKIYPQVNAESIILGPGKS